MSGANNVGTFSLKVVQYPEKMAGVKLSVVLGKVEPIKKRFGILPTNDVCLRRGALDDLVRTPL